ncbi:MAG: bacteriochlorophyll 4-vinyl reductase [Pseudomonadota bacterium]
MTTLTFDPLRSLGGDHRNNDISTGKRGRAHFGPGTRAGLVGPNAVLQLRHALRDFGGGELVTRVFESAGQIPLLLDPPVAMIDERVPARLFRAVSAELSPEHAQWVFADAGQRTADYIRENRIPRLIRLLLPRLPRALAAKLLLKAIEQHSWTFIGSGRCSRLPAPHLGLAIENNPMPHPKLAWHRAVFERLFQSLVAPDVQVHHMQPWQTNPTESAFLISIG